MHTQNVIKRTSVKMNEFGDGPGSADKNLVADHQP